MSTLRFNSHEYSVSLCVLKHVTKIAMTTIAFVSSSLGKQHVICQWINDATERKWVNVANVWDMDVDVPG